MVFSSTLGVALAKMGAKAKPVVQFFDCLGSAILNLTMMVIWVFPIGVIFLIASKIIEVDDMRRLMRHLGLYFMTVIIALAIHGIVLLPLLYGAITKRSPATFLANMSQAIATAFGTASRY